MATETRKELSGSLLNNERFARHLADLSDPCCEVTSVRLFHNQAEHTLGLLAALQNNSSVWSLEVAELHQSCSASAAELLSSVHRLRDFRIVAADTAAVPALAQGLSQSQLSSLEWGNLAAGGVRSLSEVISSWSPPHLQHLRLQQASFDSDSASSLATALSSQAACLTSLQLDRCKLDGEVDSRLFPALLRLGAYGEPCLATLDLSGSRLSAAGVSLLGQLVGCSPTLQRLHLGGCLLGDDGAHALATGLRATRSLVSLDLSDARIGVPGARALAASLQDNRSLRVLSMDDNRVGAEGCLALLAAAHVTDLSLRRNFIRGGDMTAGFQPSAASHTTYALTHREEQSNSASAQADGCPAGTAAAPAGNGEVVVQPCLQRLVLSTNSLMDVGAQVLCRALGAATGLVSLELSECGVGDSGVGAISALLADQSHLRTLHLDGNRMHTAGAQQLLQAVSEHQCLWSFRADANKITDPGVKSAVVAATQRCAARKAQAQRREREGRAARDSSSEDELPSGYLRLQAEKAAAEAAAAKANAAAGGSADPIPAPARRPRFPPPPGYAQVVPRDASQLNAGKPLSAGGSLVADIEHPQAGDVAPVLLVGGHKHKLSYEDADEADRPTPASRRSVDVGGVPDVDVGGVPDVDVGGVPDVDMGWSTQGAGRGGGSQASNPDGRPSGQSLPSSCGGPASMAGAVRLCSAFDHHSWPEAGRVEKYGPLLGPGSRDMDLTAGMAFSLRDVHGGGSSCALGWASRTSSGEPHDNYQGYMMRSGTSSGGGAPSSHCGSHSSCWSYGTQESGMWPAGAASLLASPLSNPAVPSGHAFCNASASSECSSGQHTPSGCNRMSMECAPGAAPAPAHFPSGGSGPGSAGGAGPMGVMKGSHMPDSEAGRMAGGCEGGVSRDRAVPPSRVALPRRPKYKPLTPEQQRLFADF